MQKWNPQNTKFQTYTFLATYVINFKIRKHDWNVYVFWKTSDISPKAVKVHKICFSLSWIKVPNGTSLNENRNHSAGEMILTKCEEKSDDSNACKLGNHGGQNSWLDFWWFSGFWMTLNNFHCFSELVQHWGRHEDMRVKKSPKLVYFLFLISHFLFLISYL